MPNDIRKLKRLMYAANHLKEYNPIMLRGQAATRSQALKYAWWFERFRVKLSQGVYRFSYMKREGTIREAKGTLDFSRIPKDKWPDAEKEIDRLPTPVFPYYDVEAEGWRSFRLDYFIGFVEEVG